MTNFLIGYPDIPLNSTVSASKTEDSSFPAKNLITGSRGKSHQLSTSTTDDYYLQFDRGSGNTSSSNYCAIQGANLLQGNNANAFRLRGSTQAYNTPSTISGLRAWYDFTRGITISTGISSLTDQSGVGATASQGTGANQPSWTAAGSGINGNRTGTFDGSNDSLSATGTTINVTGALTIFAVYRNTANSSDAGIFGNGLVSHCALTAHHATSKSYFYCSTAGTAIFVTTSLNNNYVLICTWTGTTAANGMKMYLNGTSVTTQGTAGAASSNTSDYTIGRMVGGGTNFTGQIAECGIYNNVISAGDLTKLYEYLRDKWQTTAPVSNTSFDSATLYGPRAEDYVSSFSASTAYRYWWAQYGANSTGSKYPHSKLHFGSWFDFGREPMYPMLQKREAYSSGSREARYIFECEWQGITDSVMEDFIDKIVKYKDVSPVILYDASDYCLNDMRQMHAWLTSAEFDKTSHNSNTIRCVFEEAL